MKIVAVIDGQGGKMGRTVIERIRAAGISCEIRAIGTNSVATTAMLRGGADAGATGENPVIVACRTADIIIGPIGILAADALLGEITPDMALAVGRSPATKLLIPVNLCNHMVVGTQNISFTALADETVSMLGQLCK